RQMPRGHKDAKKHQETAWYIARECIRNKSGSRPMKSTNEERSVKKLRCIQRSADQHWVGNGFPVRSLFTYPNLGSVLTPFLLFDYAGPMEFPPTNERLGVGE